MNEPDLNGRFGLIGTGRGSGLTLDAGQGRSGPGVSLEDDAEPIGLSADVADQMRSARSLALVDTLLRERGGGRVQSPMATFAALDEMMRALTGSQHRVSGLTVDVSRPIAGGRGAPDGTLDLRGPSGALEDRRWDGRGAGDSYLGAIQPVDQGGDAPAARPVERGHVETQLTDHERKALDEPMNLADGHAYQGIETVFPGEFMDLASMWAECEGMPVPEMERRFRDAFADLAGSPAMATLGTFRVCPTASNSIDIVAAVAAERGLAVRLVEPAFDNLALILRRRGVALTSLRESELMKATAEGTVTQLLASEPCDAVFLVQPNNPTGHTLDERAFRDIAVGCQAAGKTLLIDFTFRFYNRRPFDHYAALKESGVSFMAFEDTGKVWPTHDLKASLLFSSPDLEPLVSRVYDEIFLCHSRFALSILETCVRETSRRSLGRTIWPQVDERRSLLRDALASTPLEVSESAVDSNLPVEWLDCRKTGLDDEAVADLLRARGLHVLPGRHFFWSSRAAAESRRNIRIALMKPIAPFRDAMAVLRTLGAEIH